MCARDVPRVALGVADRACADGPFFFLGSKNGPGSINIDKVLICEVRGSASNVATGWGKKGGFEATSTLLLLRASRINHT